MLRIATTGPPALVVAILSIYAFSINIMSLVIVVLVGTYYTSAKICTVSTWYFTCRQEWRARGRYLMRAQYDVFEVGRVEEVIDRVADDVILGAVQPVHVHAVHARLHTHTHTHIVCTLSLCNTALPMS